MNIKTSQYSLKHHENASKRSLQNKILYRIMMHPHRTDPYTVICLPGRKCWEIDFLEKYDIKTYKGFGPGVKKIIAIEQDEEIFQDLKTKYQNSDLVDVFHLSTTEFMYTYQGNADLIYLDYYSYFSWKIKQDIEIMFERKILNEKGKFIINFLGARESISDQIMQKRLINNLIQLGRFELEYEDMDEDQRRCVSFNGLIGSYRRKSTTNKVYDIDGKYVATTAPIWYRYKNNAGHSMLTGHFTLNSYPKKQCGSALYKAKEVWTTDPKSQWAIRDWKKEVSTHHSDYLVALKEKVKIFYEQNHYTPSSRELGRANIQLLTQVVRELGLLPRKNRTKEDIEREVDRIYLRDGVVFLFNLCQAKIAWRRGRDSVMTVKEIESYCDMKGYAHRFDLKNIQVKVHHLTIINEFINHLLENKPKSSYKKYYNVQRILKGVSFQNAYDKKISLQNELIKKGMTEEGNLPFEYTDQQLINLYFNKNISLEAIGSLKLMGLHQIKKYWEKIGAEKMPTYFAQIKQRAKPTKIIKKFNKCNSIVETALEFNVTTKHVVAILQDAEIKP